MSKMVDGATDRLLAACAALKAQPLECTVLVDDELVSFCSTSLKGRDDALALIGIDLQAPWAIATDNGSGSIKVAGNDPRAEQKLLGAIREKGKR